MARKKQIRTVLQRRRREGKTNYKTRLKLLESGKPRLVVRKSLKNITAQIIAYKPAGDKIEVAVHSKELKNLGWTFSNNNLPAAYLVGLLVGKKALSKKVSNVILDLGLNTSTKGSKVYAVLKGVVDAGLNIPYSDSNLPSNDRIAGKHIELYRKVPVLKSFNDIKEKILKGK